MIQLLMIFQNLMVYLPEEDVEIDDYYYNKIMLFHFFHNHITILI